MKFYTYYNRPKSPVTVLDYETKFVDQSEADMCGLHYQLQRYGIDGLQARFEAMKDKFGYADTRMIPGFAELQNRIVKGNEYFNSLPSEIRKQFGNNSAEFFTYLEKNPKEAISKGYIEGLNIKDYETEPVIPITDPVTPSVQVETVENSQLNSADDSAI